MPLGHLTVVEADVDASIGVVSEIYPDNSDPILRKRIMIEDADVISQGIIALGSSPNWSLTAIISLFHSSTRKAAALPA